MGVATLIESRDFRGEYDLPRREAIVRHPDHGLLLIRDGYCGEGGIRGGAYRWDEGSVIRLRDGDSFSLLDNGAWNDDVVLYEPVVNGYDDSRPILEWEGYMIAKLAASVGL